MKQLKQFVQDLADLSRYTDITLDDISFTYVKRAGRVRVIANIVGLGNENGTPEEVSKQFLRAAKRQRAALSKCQPTAQKGEA